MSESEVKISQALGYFHWPPVWISIIPDPKLNETSKDEVYYRSLQDDINLTVRVLRDGTFIFGFDKGSLGYIPEDHDWLENSKEIEQKILIRITIMNAHLACLYSAMNSANLPAIRKMMVSPDNVLHHKNTFDGGGTYPDSMVATQTHYMSCPDNMLPDKMQTWKENRTRTISKDILDKSVDLLSAILNHQFSDCLDLVQLYTHACKAYEDYNFSFSLIIAWAVIEKIFTRFWDGYVNSENNRALRQDEKDVIGSKKSIKLKKVNNVKNRLDILLLNKIIPDSLFQSLDNARNSRNDWMHSLTPSSADDNQSTLFLAGEMLRLIYNIHLNIPLSRRIMF